MHALALQHIWFSSFSHAKSREVHSSMLASHVRVFPLINRIVYRGSSKSSPGGSNEPPDLVPQKKKIIYKFFFNLVLTPTKKNMNTRTLNFWLSSIEISLNMILSFYVVLVFLNVQSSNLISALHISKPKKSFTLTPIPKEWPRVYL